MLVEWGHGFLWLKTLLWPLGSFMRNFNGCSVKNVQKGDNFFMLNSVAFKTLFHYFLPGWFHWDICIRLAACEDWSSIDFYYWFLVFIFLACFIFHFLATELYHLTVKYKLFMTLHSCSSHAVYPTLPPNWRILNCFGKDTCTYEHRSEENTSELQSR